MYLLSGEVNFRLTTILGFANLLLLTFAFYLVYKQYRKDLFGFLPIPFILFSPLLYYVHLTSLTAYQSSLSVAFSILSLYFLQNTHQKHWYLAIFFAFASTHTMLDGISVIPLGLAWLLIQRRYRHSILYGISCLAWLVLYFSNFHFSSSSKFVFSAASLFTTFKGFLLFIGSFGHLFSDTYRLSLPLFLGIVILAGSLFLILVQLAYPANSVKRISLDGFTLPRIELLDLCVMRLFATAAMISLGRSAMNLEDMVAIRFHIYSLSIVIICYLLLVRIIGPHFRKAFSIASLSISILCTSFAYSKYQNSVVELRNGLIADTYNYTHSQIFLHQYYNLPDPQAEFYRNYSFPVFFDEALFESSVRLKSSSNKLSITSEDIPTIRQSGGYIYNLMELKIQQVPPYVPHKEVFLVLLDKQNQGKKYLIGVNTIGNSFAEKLFPPKTQTFHGKFLDKIPESNYEAHLYWKENKRLKSLLVTSDFLYN